MRILGIDYGTKRVGLAMTDESGLMGFPLQVVPNDERLLPTLTSLIIEKQVGAVVVGQSLGKDGRENPLMSSITALIGDLTRALSIPIHLEPEHYSTHAAVRLQGRSDMTDAAAAAILLNSYLERIR